MDRECPMCDSLIYYEVVPGRAIDEDTWHCSNTECEWLGDGSRNALSSLGDEMGEHGFWHFIDMEANGTCPGCRKAAEWQQRASQ